MDITVLNIETIITLIVAAAPSIVAIISIILAVVIMIKAGKVSNQEIIDKFEETRKELLDMREFETLKRELKLAHMENRELKKLCKELLTKIDHIARGVDDEKQ